MKVVRKPGFYWVCWIEGDRTPFIAEWVEYVKGTSAEPPPRPFWWEIMGTDSTFDDENVAVLSDRLHEVETAKKDDTNKLVRLVDELANTEDEVLRDAFEALPEASQNRLRDWLGRAVKPTGKGFVPGTVVCLASGGPKMTVLERIEGKVSGFTESKTVCRCMFCFESKLVEAMIPEVALKLAKEEAGHGHDT